MPLDFFVLPGGFNRAPDGTPGEASVTGVTVDACAVPLTGVSGAAGAATDASGGRDGIHPMSARRLRDQLDTSRAAIGALAATVWRC
jgi:hypothetical protein